MKTEEPIPTWTLERYLLDELPAATRRKIEEQLPRDPALRTELEQLRRSNREILERYPAGPMAATIRNHTAAAMPNRLSARVPPPRLLWMALPALALAISAWFFLPPLFRQEFTDRDGYIGIKGVPAATPGLLVFRKNKTGSESLSPGSTSRAGDLLQLAYIPGRASDGVILSIDGNGGVTLHFPETPAGSTSLQRKKRVFLRNAYELDDTPGFERFFLITAAEKLPVSRILEKARQLAADPHGAKTGRLDLPGRFRQVSLLVSKGERK